MILNGKAKKDFFNWLDNQGVNGIDISNWEFEKFHLLSNVSQNSLIIEWFDSVGIYISVKRLCTSLKFRCWYFIITNEDGNYLNNHGADESRINNDSRIEITIKAIKNANEIYNSTL